jgi:glucoamylase
LNTIKLIDGELKVEMPTGPCWHRFVNDTYGEDDAGNPFFDNGKGRAWPLLTGERAHYEVAAGNLQEAKNLLKTLESFSYHEMLPEQIWDTADIPSKDLFFGQYTGSAMPLTWAHAEYIKLCQSVRQKKVFDMPEHTYKRYILDQTKSDYSAWRFSMPIEKISRQKKFLRIEVMSPATIHWTNDGWQTKNEIDTKESTVAIHYADISLEQSNATEIVFTFFWKDPNNWENKNFTISIVD